MIAKSSADTQSVYQDALESVEAASQGTEEAKEVKQEKKVKKDVVSSGASEKLQK